MRLLSGSKRKQSAADDQDSLVAMDALLQIGQGTHSASNLSSSSRPTMNVIAPSSSPYRASCEEMSKERWSEASNKITATINSLLPFHASNVFISQNGHSPVAIAAAQVAAGSSACKSAIVGTSGMLAPFSLLLPSTGATSLVGEQPILAAKWGGEMSPAHVRRSSDSISSSSHIRVEKVAEALRSKPQRGRKRDDLNDNERVELTRTRNREHAKSTRIRKKARYQELLDREEIYLKMHERDVLQSERRDCVLKLIALRRRMLLDHMRHVQDAQQSGERTYPSDHTHANIRMELSELVLDAASFAFDSMLPGGASPDSEEAYAKMLEWDGALASRLMHFFSSQMSDIISSLSFDIESGVEGIAQSNSDLAFCHLTLEAKLPSVQNHDQVVTKLITSGICSFTFGVRSNRLVSMRWTALDDQCFGGFLRSIADESKGGNHPPFDPYQRQMIHPSVVSLDHIRNAETDEFQGLDVSL